MNNYTINHIHFIDDSDDEHLVSSLFLRKANINIKMQNYYTPTQVFKKIADSSIDFFNSILVVDLNLAAFSGIDVIRKIRSDRRFDLLIAGVCSGSEDPADQKESMDAGADFFVTKPLSLTSLLTICSSVPSLKMCEDKNELKYIVREVA